MPPLEERLAVNPARDPVTRGNPPSSLAQRRGSAPCGYYAHMGQTRKRSPDLRLNRIMFRLISPAGQSLRHAISPCCTHAPVAAGLCCGGALSETGAKQRHARGRPGTSQNCVTTLAKTAYRIGAGRYLIPVNPAHEDLRNLRVRRITADAVLCAITKSRSQIYSSASPEYWFIFALNRLRA